MEIKGYLHPRETSPGTVLGHWSYPLDVSTHMVRQAHHLGLPRARVPVDVAHGRHTHSRQCPLHNPGPAPPPRPART